MFPVVIVAVCSVSILQVFVNEAQITVKKGGMSKTCLRIVYSLVLSTCHFGRTTTLHVVYNLHNGLVGNIRNQHYKGRWFLGVGYKNTLKLLEDKTSSGVNVYNRDGKQMASILS